MYSTVTKFKNESKFIKKYPLIFKKFRPLKHLSKGAFSDIYAGINIHTKEKVALKVEERYKMNKNLEAECYYLFSLKGLGIPKVISFGHNKDYDILVLPLLGKSLHEIQSTKNFNFEFKDICLIAIQIIERIQWVHSQKIIHRDIKPDNFLIGIDDPNIIYLIDFGLSKKYRSSITGNHIKCTHLKKFTGSLRYASINALRLREQSRRDDLESIGYMLIYLIKGRLPWDNIRIDNKRSSYIKFSEYKRNIRPELLCSNLPEEFCDYIKYVKNLNFEDEPDYNYLKSLFQIMLNKQGFEEKKIFFSWINENNINKIKKEINLSKRTSSSRERILNKIRKSMNNKRSISEINNGINSENYNEDEDNKYTYNLKNYKKKKNLEENDRGINEVASPKIFESNNQPIINNFIYSYISPTNHININNDRYQNQYQFNFPDYNPFKLRNNENKIDVLKPNLNLKKINSPRIQKNFEVNYEPIITYTNENDKYQLNRFIGNYQDINNVEIKNKLKSNNYNNNNYNIKKMKNNINHEPNKILSISYNQKKDTNQYFPQNPNQNHQVNKIIKIPLSYVNTNINTNINTKNIESKNPKGFGRIKNFNLWNISPFKKRNNQTQINNNMNKRINNENNIKTSQLMDEIKKFNNQYNINIKKTDKNLIKNKMMKKIKLQQVIKTNQSADSNKLFRMKKKIQNGNNIDKNCNIF